jgi:hypothetical protein
VAAGTELTEDIDQRRLQIVTVVLGDNAPADYVPRIEWVSGAIGLHRTPCSVSSRL